MNDTGHKLAALYLKEYFEAYPNQLLTSDKLRDMLYSDGIEIGRKALAEYIRALCEYGMDIVSEVRRGGGYCYIAPEQEEGDPEDG